MPSSTDQRPGDQSSVLQSVNVSRVQTVEHHGRAVETGIFKTPVTGPVAVEGVNLAGDVQADLSVHGGKDKAVYAYALEDYAWWADKLAHPMEPGSFGENLTTAGLDVSKALIGEHWRIGTVLLEVSQPRSPCFKLGIAMNDGRFPIAFKQADRPGAYLRIIEPGVLSTGDPIKVTDQPATSLSVAEVARISNRDREEAHRLLEVAALPEPFKEWAAHQIEKSRRR
jgi:MOSC domain-containing protein YiiM